MPTLDFAFDELACATLYGIESAPLIGTAKITYHRDGDWYVSGILLTGYWRYSGERAKIRVVLHPKRDAQLYQSLVDQLETRWRRRIDTAVELELAEAA